MLRLYWDIGRLIHERQGQKGWGAGVIPRLANDLRNELPELKGFSERNLKRMLAFHREYVDISTIVPQPVAQLTDLKKVPQPVAQLATPALPLWNIPWGHHALLLEKVKDLSTRIWYMHQALAQGWSRNTLGLMIGSRTHERQGQIVSNFADRLPAPQSELVQQIFKDPYLFDFLTLEEPFHERELETGLVRHLEKFLLELGQGFAFVGRQYRLVVGDQDFYFDLLFYHLRLRSFVVIDLKTGDFKPEYAGKMNFYCSTADAQLRHEADQPTIGLILCQTKDRIIAEYALRDIHKPVGVAAYELTRALPKELASNLPSIEQIEAELQSELGEPPHLASARPTP
jgi:predicted nuclease of restriction endonuclease-like (RecB) superfamily